MDLSSFHDIGAAKQIYIFKVEKGEFYFILEGDFQLTNVLKDKIIS